MPLQNRVTPLGDIVATPERGSYTGNRGIIHDPATKTLLKRRWSNRAWITCVCDFRGRRRDVMATRSWTELFFLDEATAFAAGHRPCFYCRRDDAEKFRAAWCKGNALASAKASAIDVVLHAERLDGRLKRVHPLPRAFAGLPDGTVIAIGAAAYIIANGKPRRWSFAGYGPDVTLSDNAVVVTPPSVLRAFDAGYQPQCHPSANALP